VQELKVDHYYEERDYKGYRWLKVALMGETQCPKCGFVQSYTFSWRPWWGKRVEVGRTLQMLMAEAYATEYINKGAVDESDLDRLLSIACHVVTLHWMLHREMKGESLPYWIQEKAVEWVDWVESLKTT